MTRPNLALTALTALSALTLAAGVGACGADFNDGGGSSFSDTSNWTSADTTGGGTSAADTWSSGGGIDAVADASGPDIGPPPPPEQEVDYDLRTPEAGARYLYIPSAGLDALVVVDATTLAVSLVDVGVAPTLVRALPQDRGAVVLNSGSDDVSIVRPDGAGGFRVRTLDVLPRHNRLELSPDGRFAFAFYDTRAGGAAGSLQDVNAVRLAAGDEAVLNVAVGLRPTELIFKESGQLALFFCENGISGIRLDELVGDTFLPPVAVKANPFEKPIDREIVVTPEGRLAVVRDLNAPVLTLVDLQTAARSTLPLADWPSDLEMTPDGGTVIVPMKASAQVAIVAVPEAFAWEAPEPEVPAEGGVDGEEPVAAPENPYVTLVPTGAAFGSASMTSDGGRALLFTTERGTKAVGMLDLGSAQAFLQPTPKEVVSVLVSPDGRMAALIHRDANDDAADLRNVPAYTLLDLATGYAKLVTVADPVTKVIFTADSSELFALMPGSSGGRGLVHRVSTTSFAVIDYETPMAPVYVGAMPAVSKVAIALDDPSGWITFVDTDDGQVSQVNSFELNSFIR
ncbi:MAG: hypothetical protein KC635_13835 [Myxococcales bacterium]|nr:hypothetical protein [Myxococcales bacterium]MCB9734069.1 hypothetical protein [Deltaproteobacteria bacterium]